MDDDRYERVRQKGVDNCFAVPSSQGLTASTVAYRNDSGLLFTESQLELALEGNEPRKMPLAVQRDLAEGAYGEDMAGKELVTDSDVPQGNPAGDRRLHQLPTIAEGVKDLIQASTQMLRTWSTPLCERESFELFCPSKAEKLLNEAKAIERDLLSQKEKLRGRLMLVSKTLRQMNDKPA